MHHRPQAVILEDHPLVREALKSRLQAAIPGVEVAYCGDVVSEALRAVEVPGKAIAMLDLDLGDGASPIENTTRFVDAGFRVLIVSALADPATVRSALLAGALGYVSKAAPLEDLTASLSATLAGEASTSQDVASILASDSTSAVQLSERERTAMVLYASGLKIDAVARRMGVKSSTAQEYIRRVRGKYLRAGTALPSKTDLYKQAKEEGLVT